MLRFALAAIVLVGHSGIKVLPFVTPALAVKVFFALSGWLIGGILLHTKKHDLPRFYFNRATRIWIPYGVAVALLYGLALVKEGAGFYWFKYLLLDVTFTHQLYTFFPQALAEMPLGGSGNQFWSIAVEEQFYLVAPLLMLFAPWGRTLKLWIPLALVTIAFDLNTASVALGVCAAIAQRDHGIARISWVRATAVMLIGVSAAVMWVVPAPAGEYIVGPLFSVCLVLLLAVKGERTRFGIIAGGVSFPLYLNQWIGSFVVNFFVKRGLEMAHWIEIAATCAVSIAVGFALYWLIDRQVQRHRNAWFSPKLGVALGVTAYALVVTGIAAGGLMHLYGPHGQP